MSNETEKVDSPTHSDRCSIWLPMDRTCDCGAVETTAVDSPQPECAGCKHNIGVGYDGVCLFSTIYMGQEWFCKHKCEFPAADSATPKPLQEGTDGYQFHVCGNAEGGGEQFYVWMFQIEPYQQAHEFHHLAHDILFTRGMTCCEANEEAFAYLTGRLHEMFEERRKGKVSG